MSVPDQRQANRNFSRMTDAPQSSRWHPARQSGTPSPKYVTRGFKLHASIRHTIPTFFWGCPTG